jgi:hypothetical protein
MKNRRKNRENMKNRRKNRENVRKFAGCSKPKRKKETNR